MDRNFLNLIKKEIKDNSKELQKLAQIDKKYNLNTFDLDKCIKLIDDYKMENMKLNKKIGIVYFGNIELTICACIYAIMNDIQLTLFIQDYLVRIK